MLKQNPAPLSPDTIEVLAEALSSENNAVFPEDLTISPKEIATAFLRAYAEYEREMVDHIRHLFADDLQVVYPGGDACAPLAGIHHGADGFDALNRKFFEIFQRPDKQIVLRTSMITTEGNRATITCVEKLCNEFIPPDAAGGQFALLLMISRGKIATVHFLFETLQFAAVLTAWREGKTGEALNADDTRYMEKSRWRESSDVRG